METVIELDGKKVKLVADMKRLRMFETKCCSCFEIYSFFSNRSIPFHVIVDFYYYFQDNSAHTQEQLCNIVLNQSLDDRLATFTEAFGGLFPAEGKTEKKPTGEVVQ